MNRPSNYSTVAVAVYDDDDDFCVVTFGTAAFADQAYYCCDR